MNATAPVPAASAIQEARMGFRRETARVMREPSSAGAHLARLGAALALTGSEPAQGALADFFSLDAGESAALRPAALALVAERLPAHVRRAFEARLDGRPLRSPTPLATRWSVLAQPSVDIPMRARRASPDDSRELAAQAVAAIGAGDTDATAQFLDHCITCRDNLAFMLARRSLLKAGVAFPEGWDAAAQVLEQPREAP